METVDVLDQVLEVQANRTKERERQFRELVNAIASGDQAPAPVQVEAVLHETGRTVDDLRAAVNLRRQRMAWRRAIDEAAELQPEIDAIIAAVAEENRRFAAVQAEHQGALKRLGEQHRALMCTLPDTAAAYQGLERTTPQELLDRMAELAAEQRKLNLTIKGHRDEAARYWAGQSSNVGPVPMEYSGFDKWSNPGEEWQTPAQKAENARCREKAREHTEAAEALLPRVGELETEIDLLHRRTVDVA